jgi:hypothetical protein
MNGRFEHPTEVGTIDRTVLHADSDEASRELVHDHEHPVAPEHDGLASKEIHAPQAVSRVSDERQPRGPSLATRLGGAWQQKSEGNLTTGTTAAAPNPRLHLIYLDGQYVQFAAAVGRPKLKEQIDAANLTKERLQQRSGPGRLQGQYGTYRISGNTLTRTPISAAAPENEGRRTVSEFRIQGDTLKTVTPDPEGQKIERTYKRLRSAM